MRRCSRSASCYGEQSETGRVVGMADAEVLRLSSTCVECGGRQGHGAPNLNRCAHSGLGSSVFGRYPAGPTSTGPSGTKPTTPRVAAALSGGLGTQWATLIANLMGSFTATVAYAAITHAPVRATTTAEGPQPAATTKP
jgi:hypothetical protein